MRKLFSTAINIISIVIITSFLLYAGGWLFIAHHMQQQVDKIWESPEKYHLVINGEKPKVSGFPAPPKIIFSGNVTDQRGTVYQSPEFIYQGFPLPTQSMSVKAPNGIDFSSPLLNIPIHLDSLEFKVRLPRDFPFTFDAPTLKNWQVTGGSLPVEHLFIQRGTLKLTGDGYLNLDENLQLAGTLSVRLSGLDDLVHELSVKGVITDKHVLVAQSMINFISKTDDVTGETYVLTGLTIQQGGVFLGPLRVATLPRWRWTSNP